MKKLLFVATMLLVSVATFAQKLSPDQIVGVWQCEDYKIEFYKSGNTYSAKLLWSKSMFETDGKTPKKDSKNPDEKLKNRSIEGITHITGLTYKNGEYIDAKLYSVDDGNTYSLKGVLKDANNLETRGYKGIPMLGKTYKWTRVK
ncbi:DUF2147 domain-containing protein [Pedobacter chinensis]|uniref:DUF2147 domain-containing protein n=1 Tax=Pedobacter chinensis TaxID=2282421 RepID=A0A369Q017_9SPHI|nr:DUF2147 domain-containing protein [Pedobacter chinensis]RDC55668.1 DUF2147 domain-containing protein [Pedobacter chinensis]